MNTENYSYRVEWSEDDAEYVGLCSEFPSLSWLARTPGACFQGIRKIVADVVSDLAKSNEAIPKPLVERE